MWSRELKEYCSSDNSLLKHTSPAELAAFSNKLVCHEVAVMCSLWNSAIRGAAGKGTKTKPDKATNVLALCSSALAKFRNKFRSLSDLQIPQLLPAMAVQTSFKADCSVLVSRIVSKYLQPFKQFNDVVVNHIPHRFPRRWKKIRKGKRISLTFRKASGIQKKMRPHIQSPRIFHQNLAKYQNMEKHGILYHIKRSSLSLKYDPGFLILPLTLSYTILTEIVPHSYKFYWKKVPLSYTWKTLYRLRTWRFFVIFT